MQRHFFGRPFSSSLDQNNSPESNRSSQKENIDRPEKERLFLNIYEGKNTGPAKGNFVQILDRIQIDGVQEQVKQP